MKWRYRRIAVKNPATGGLIAEVLSSTEEDVSKCVEIAKQAFQSGVWSRASSLEKCKVLTTLARLLESHVSECARLETLQTGRPIRELNAQLSRLPEWL